jgi:hypothetical protein
MDGARKARFFCPALDPRQLQGFWLPQRGDTDDSVAERTKGHEEEMS